MQGPFIPLRLPASSRYARYAGFAATDRDANAIAELFFASCRLLTFPSTLNTIEEYYRFVAGIILKQSAVTVTQDIKKAATLLGVVLDDHGHHRPQQPQQAARSESELV
jgi:hypothetical protein